MAMLSRHCAGVVRRWAGGTFGFIHDTGRPDKLGQSGTGDHGQNGAHRV